MEKLESGQMDKCLTENYQVEMKKEGKYCNFFFIVQVNWAGSAERESESEYINQRKRAEKEGERGGTYSSDRRTDRQIR